MWYAIFYLQKLSGYALDALVKKRALKQAVAKKQFMIGNLMKTNLFKRTNAAIVDKGHLGQIVHHIQFLYFLTRKFWHNPSEEII